VPTRFGRKIFWNIKLRQSTNQAPIGACPVSSSAATWLLLTSI
jgi:hypothetical protein